MFDSVCFFFSSRRRHTRWPRDWSSDVCSSDLAEQRWTFGDMATSVQAARMGFGFARYPEEKIREEVAAGELKVLPLQGGGDMYGEIYLVLADPEGAGPGIRRLAEILRED